MPAVSAQYSIILRVEIDHRPGMLGRVATAIGEAGGSISSVDLVTIEHGHTLRDITIETAGEEHATKIGQAVDTIDGARTVDITDRTFQMHVGGKIEQRNKLPVSDARRPEHGLHARRGARLHGDRRRTATARSSTRSSATRSPSSPTAAPCSASATSGPRPRCP